jgi:hypothetical protein
MLACADYTIGPESVLSWQRYDYSINCDSTKYTKVRYAAGLMLVLYPIGIPVFALWIFRKNRKRLLDRSHHRHSIEDDEATSPDEDRPAPAKTSIWTFFGAGALKAKKPWWHGNRDTFYFMVRDYKPQYYYFVRTPTYGAVAVYRVCCCSHSSVSFALFLFKKRKGANVFFKEK